MESNVASPFSGEYCSDNHCGSVELADLSESVRTALAALSPQDHWLIEQLFWDGHTEAEVARQLHISQPAVNKRKHTILKKLRGWLGG